MPDEPGNEAGYVVKMTDDTLERPYKIAPGTRVRLESAYEGDVRRLGVMVAPAYTCSVQLPLFFSPSPSPTRQALQGTERSAYTAAGMMYCMSHKICNFSVAAMFVLKLLLLS